MKKPEFHVVVGHPFSDIGKGWLSSCVGRSLGPDTAMIKIDPMLSPEFPRDLGVPVENTIVTDDAATYQSQGLHFHPDQNIVLGGWMAQHLKFSALEEGILAGEVPKITVTDLSYRMAEDIERLTAGNKAVIEMGGCPDDPESVIPIGAIKVLARKRKIRLHLMTAFDYTTRDDDNHDAKTRPPVRAITETLRAYAGIALRDFSVYIRRNHLPASVPDERLVEAGRKVAFKTFLLPQQVRYIPNLASPAELYNYLEWGEEQREVEL